MIKWKYWTYSEHLEKIKQTIVLYMWRKRQDVKFVTNKKITSWQYGDMMHFTLKQVLTTMETQDKPKRICV
jgi:hypothetical protein